MRPNEYLFRSVGYTQLLTLLSNISMRILLATLLSVGALSAQAAPAKAVLHINALTNTPAAEVACGLFLENSQEELVFVADTHYQGFVRVNDKFTELAHIKTKNQVHTGSKPHTGDRYTSQFAVEGVSANLAMAVMQGCENYGDKCDEVKVKGTLSVSSKQGKVKIAVSGSEYCQLSDD